MSIALIIVHGLCAGDEGNQFYDQSNPFYSANMLFDGSKYGEAIEEYERIFKMPVEDKKLIAYARLCYAQAHWAIGRHKKGFKEFNTYLGKDGSRPSLKKPLQRKDLRKLNLL